MKQRLLTSGQVNDWGVENPVMGSRTAGRRLTERAKKGTVQRKALATREQVKEIKKDPRRRDGKKGKEMAGNLGKVMTSMSMHHAGNLGKVMTRMSNQDKQG